MPAIAAAALTAGASLIGASRQAKAAKSAANTQAAAEEANRQDASAQRAYAQGVLQPDVDRGERAQSYLDALYYGRSRRTPTPSVAASSPFWPQPVQSSAARRYLDANPDVERVALQKGWDPETFAYQHYNEYGVREGRAWPEDAAPTPAASADPTASVDDGYITQADVMNRIAANPLYQIGDQDYADQTALANEQFGALGSQGARDLTTRTGLANLERDRAVALAQGYGSDIEARAGSDLGYLNTLAASQRGQRLGAAQGDFGYMTDLGDARFGAGQSANRRDLLARTGLSSAELSGIINRANSTADEALGIEGARFGDTMGLVGARRGELDALAGTQRGQAYSTADREAANLLGIAGTRRGELDGLTGSQRGQAYSTADRRATDLLGISGARRGELDTMAGTQRASAYNLAADRAGALQGIEDTRLAGTLNRERGYFDTREGIANDAATGAAGRSQGDYATRTAQTADRLNSALGRASSAYGARLSEADLALGVRLGLISQRDAEQTAQAQVEADRARDAVFSRGGVTGRIGQTTRGIAEIGQDYARDQSIRRLTNELAAYDPYFGARSAALSEKLGATDAATERSFDEGRADLNTMTGERNQALALRDNRRLGNVDALAAAERSGYGQYYDARSGITSDLYGARGAADDRAYAQYGQNARDFYQDRGAITADRYGAYTAADDRAYSQYGQTARNFYQDQSAIEANRFGAYGAADDRAFSQYGQNARDYFTGAGAATSGLYDAARDITGRRAGAIDAGYGAYYDQTGRAYDQYASADTGLRNDLFSLYGSAYQDYAGARDRADDQAYSAYTGNYQDYSGRIDAARRGVYDATGQADQQAFSDVGRAYDIFSQGDQERTNNLFAQRYQAGQGRSRARQNAFADFTGYLTDEQAAGRQARSGQASAGQAYVNAASNSRTAAAQARAAGALAGADAWNTGFNNAAKAVGDYWAQRNGFNGQVSRSRSAARNLIAANPDVF